MTTSRTIKEKAAISKALVGDKSIRMEEDRWRTK